MVSAVQSRSIGLFFILCLMAFNFVVVGKYAAYPWWHQHDCDSDPLYVAQALTIVNDGPFDYIHHPGAVVSSGHGFAYRLASAIAGWHPEYLNLQSSAQNLSEWDVLEETTRLSRRLSFGVFGLFVATFYVFALWLTRNGVVTFLVAFFVASSQVAIWHSRAIRPEIPSLLFSLLAMWVALALGRSLARGNERGFALGSVAVGFLLAFAMLSKIQILPVAAAVLLLGFWFVVSKGEWTTRNAQGRRLRVYLFVGLAVAAITPWWALVKPDFVTESYLASVGYFDRLVYGSAAKTFVPLVAGVLAVSLAGSVAAILLNRRWNRSRGVDRLGRAAGFLHLVALGAILGIYAVLAPVSRTLASYTENTHHLVYGMLANTFGNVFGSGFLQHKAVDGHTVTRILEAHALGDRLLGINVAWLILLMAAVVIVRLASPKTVGRGEYWLVLLVLMIGVVMDVVFTFRWIAQFNYYAMFSLVYYGIGMAIFLTLEHQNLWVERGWFRVSYGVAILLVALLLSQVGYRTFEIATGPRATGTSEQSPDQMIEASKAQNPHYWHLFEESP
jgi:hypothetical protein